MYGSSSTYSPANSRTFTLSSSYVAPRTSHTSGLTTMLSQPPINLNIEDWEEFEKEARLMVG